MNRSLSLILTLSVLVGNGGDRGGLFAQDGRSVPHTGPMTSGCTVEAVPVPFGVDSALSGCSVPQAPIAWGMDVAWNSADNVQRGTNYIGQDCLQVGRVSFQPSDLVGEDLQLSSAQQATLQSRLDNIALSGVKDIILNCDHEVLCNADAYPNCAQSYANYYGNAQAWYRVIKASVLYCRKQGYNVVTISPFNEPDYTDWKEGTKAHFKAIAQLLSEDADLQGIRISAGNTLNCDQALSWYQAVLPYATEGNTHQLAGSFDSYAAFWQQVRANGHHATADELHNVGEALIGAHYGMQSGVWWGWDGAARGEYCRASVSGGEIGYGEDRSAWAAAAVYKRESGRVDAFIGTSERQATPSSFSLLCTDRPAYYDGYGPYYSYQLSMPGGTGYQQGQTNAERMVTVQYGADVPLDPIQPDSSYVIMNAHSKMCLGSYNNSTTSGTTLAQRKYGIVMDRGYVWTVEALPSGSTGDLGYFKLRWAKETSYLIDVLNWSTSAGGSMILYPGSGGTNEQWFAEYAGDDYWYIRSRHSGLYLEVKDASTQVNAYVVQGAYTGADNQKWRFMPSNDKPKLETVAPAAPADLSAEVRSASVRLTWTAGTESDLKGYVVLRDGDVIARMLTSTEYIDNDVRPGVTHQYAVRAVDASRNQSADSDPVQARLSDEPALILHYTMEGDTLDQTENMLDPISADALSYNALHAMVGEQSLQLNGTTSRYLALPPAVGYYDEMTLSMWVCYSYTDSWQRFFDLGNGTDQYIFLTPSNGSEMRLVCKNRGEEQVLSMERLKAGGTHFVAVTMSADSVTLYVDGNYVSSHDITIRPTDILPKHNYLGWSQFAADPPLRGYIDDVRMYNCALSIDQLSQLYKGDEPVALPVIEAAEMSAPTPAYDLWGRRLPASGKNRGWTIGRDKKIIK
ncbi:MAG: RICIN domain-containing protein [Bacteroidales bacterium]|nr:RICIN domain-containing protein [Bacteroidales bacterium]